MSRFERNTPAPTSFDWTPLVASRRNGIVGEQRRKTLEQRHSRFRCRERNNEITLGASFIKFTSGAERDVTSRAAKYEILFSAALSLSLSFARVRSSVLHRR